MKIITPQQHQQESASPFPSSHASPVTRPSSAYHPPYPQETATEKAKAKATASQELSHHQLVAEQQTSFQPEKLRASYPFHQPEAGPHV